MSRQDALKNFQAQIDRFVEDGLIKEERLIASEQGPEIVCDGKRILNFCSNSYLDLARHPKIIQAASAALKSRGFGMSSVRFICGTLDLHKELEEKITAWMKTDATIIFPSAFDANSGLFESLLGEEDAVISDALNHASIIDGIRLCKAKRFRYENGNLDDLEEKLKSARAQNLKTCLIVTDGVFSMDGITAPLSGIAALADKYDALMMVDDSHASGFIGPDGRGTPALYGVDGRVDIVTSTFGKALGGASGGFVSGRKEIIDLLRQKSRPYLFSNALPPVVAGATLQALDIVREEPERQAHLMKMTQLFVEGMVAEGFNFPEKTNPHPICPVLIGDAHRAKDLSAALFHEGIHAVAFSYPVVPKNKARIRVQISSGHTLQHIEKVLEVWKRCGRACRVISS